MKKIILLVLFILFSFSITACSNYPYPDDLPDKGGLSIIIIIPSDEPMRKPDFLKNHYLEYDVYKINVLDYDHYTDSYPSLDIDSAPYYIFLDSEGIVFETEDIKEAEEYFYNNANKKRN